MERVTIRSKEKGDRKEKYGATMSGLSRGLVERKEDWRKKRS